MIFKETIEAQLRLHIRIREQISKALKEMPDGNMLRKRSGDRIYYYISLNGKRISLNHNPEMREIYLLKEELVRKLRAVEKDIPLLEKTAKEYLPVYPDGEQWEKIKSEQNKYKEEERKHLYKGIYYRSKSEAVIAMLLESYGIEFKYEVRLEVGSRTVYPDFVIRRKRDGKIILWEHFGLIHNEEYRQGMFRKLIDYHEAGYNIWDNLIVSFESENGSINVDSIEKMISLYLL